MTPHLHSQHVPGCYRCDLSLDEVANAREEAGNLDLLRQTFNVVDETYDTEPVVSPPTPGFFRRKSSKAPAGTMALFEMDESARTEYDR